MAGDVEMGKCDTCGTETVGVARQYYFYGIECLCCNGNSHFVFVYHCANCQPIEPTEICIQTSNIKKVER